MTNHKFFVSLALLFLAACASPLGSASQKIEPAASATRPTRVEPPSPALQPSTALTPGVAPSPAPSAIGPSSSADAPSGWATFVRKDWHVAIDYPPDWLVGEQESTVTFTSPQGATIAVGLLDSGNDTSGDEMRALNVYCSTSTNAFGIEMRTCLDTMSFTHMTDFSVSAPDGVARRFSVLMNGRNPAVFEAMLASVRAAP